MGGVSPQSDRMNSLALTKHYFAEWLDTEPSLLDRESTFFILSPKRDTQQRGYSDPFDLYCLITSRTRIVSYGQRLLEHIGCIERCFTHEANLDQVKASLREHLGVYPGHAYKYYFTDFPAELDTSRTKQLDRSDYQDFKDFFQRQYPHISSVGAEQYFNAIVDAGYAYGIYVDQQLVSVTDAPDVPYMQDVIVELGVNTLPEYRQQGYAKMVVGASVKYLLKRGKLPIWSCGFSNIPSQKLAESVGFVKFADVLTLTCSPI